jgi:hypothetical protein
MRHIVNGPVAILPTQELKGFEAWHTLQVTATPAPTLFKLYRLVGGNLKVVHRNITHAWPPWTVYFSWFLLLYLTAL